MGREEGQKWGWFCRLSEWGKVKEELISFER